MGMVGMARQAQAVRMEAAAAAAPSERVKMPRTAPAEPVEQVAAEPVERTTLAWLERRALTAS